MTGHRREGSARTDRAGLHTDLYELRMVDSYLQRGMTAPATFSLFIRPAAARPWYVALGVHRLLELLDTFRFGPSEIAYLRTLGFGEPTLSWLASFEPRGEVWAVPDGTVVLAQEPIVEITAPLPVAQLLETAAINLVQYPAAVATKAARCALAAQGRRLADFGLRRAHGLETGAEAAMAAFVGGGFATSNVEAGRRWKIPVTGTMAHSYIQAFTDEQDAFRAFAADHPDHSTLLVDTYDTIEGVARAIDATEQLRAHGQRLHGVRLDSGELGDLARQTRKLLDDAGLDDTQIVASGGLDEYRIHELVSQAAPIDAFGIGSALTTSSDHPALDIVYKLVAYDQRPVAKFSGVKSTLPGRKQVFRTGGDPTDDVLSVRDADETGQRLLAPVWRDGQALRAFDLTEARERTASQLHALPPDWQRPPYLDDPPLPRLGTDLEWLNQQVRRAAFE